MHMTRVEHGNLIYIKMSIMYANTLHNGSIELQKKGEEMSEGSFSKLSHRCQIGAMQCIIRYAPS